MTGSPRIWLQGRPKMPLLRPLSPATDDTSRLR